ncbi:MAG: metallophosphoesterase [Synergistaceae bacterium]|jgi:predicted MPP superfamily phosphohydrolase|nr:metallophosphoesterase [Synergistaceae bacterium]
MNGAGSRDGRFSDRPRFWWAFFFVMLSVHAYLYAAEVRKMPSELSSPWLLAGASALLASASAPLLGPPKNNTGRISLQSALQRSGALWNFFVLFSAAYMTIIRVISVIHEIPARAVFPASLFASLLTCLYGLFEARNVRSVFLSLKTRKLKRKERLRVVQISDLHIGPFMNVGHIARVVRAALMASPDLVVVTGDTVDGEVGGESETLPFYRPFSKTLLAISESGPGLGVWAISGNHDYYENFAASLRFIESAGFRLLRGEKVDLGEIVLIGADDMDHETRSDANGEMTRSEELIDSLSPDERNKFVLLLRHRPIIEESSLGKFDLQLSGHTHGGQLVPLPSSRHRIPGRSRGLLALPRGSNIYVSNGAGFVGPPLRFFAPAEIVVIDLAGE